jgi:hypothetical protein
MEEEFPAPTGVVVESASLFVGMDIGIDQPGFFTIYVYIGLVNTDLMIAYRLYLGTLENKACLIGIQDVEVKISLFILGYRFAAHGLILTQIDFQGFPHSMTILVP